MKVERLKKIFNRTVEKYIKNCMSNMNININNIDL
jgi:hypothetical protein